MPTNVKDLMAAARAAVPVITPAAAAELAEKHDALIVDVRDSTEIAASGKVKGAVAVSRGMLEFRADPESSSHDPAFRKDRPIVVYCASGGTFGTCRQDAARPWLQGRPQPRRLQGLGRRRRTGRARLISPTGLFGLPSSAGANAMTISLVAIQPLVALVAGILILLMPRLLNFIVAIYLIIHRRHRAVAASAALRVRAETRTAAHMIRGSAQLRTARKHRRP